jgi:hypothetical protein
VTLDSLIAAFGGNNTEAQAFEKKNIIEGG